MTRALAVAAALLLALPALAGAGAAESPPAAHPDSPQKAALLALRALAQEDVVEARALLAPYEPFQDADAEVKLAAGTLRFFEQRYDEAVALMEASGLGAGGGYLPLARNAQAVTRGFARSESEHFVVAYPKGKDEVLGPYLVDALERQRAVLAKTFGEPPPGKLAVEVVSDVKDLARLTTLTEAEIRTSGTVAVSKFAKLMLLSPKALLKGYDWLDTAAHEYTHTVVTERTRNRAPIWLQEGLAKWFETAWRGGVDPVTPFSAALVREAVAKGDLVTFEEMHPSLAKLPSQERAALAYAQVVMAVEFLVQRAGAPSLGKVAGRIAEGRTAEQAVSDVLGEPCPRFVEEWKRHMAQRPLPRGGEHELKKLRFRDDPKHGGAWAEWSEIPDERSRGFARLGEIYRERGRWAAARVEYGKAYARVGARIPILSGQYALAAVMSGARPEAEKILSEALAWNPDYPALNVAAGRLMLDKQDFAAARDRLLAANRQDPADPEIHAGLARALEALGDAGGASREARFAQLLTGGHP